MGIFDMRAFKSAPPKSGVQQRASYNPSWLSDFNKAFYAANRSISEYAMNEQTALTIAAVWSANRLLSEIPASLNLQLRKKKGEYFGLETSGSLAKVLRNPNSFQTSYTFYSSMFFKMNLRGNAYAFIKRKPNGEKELIMVYSDNTSVSVSPDGSEVFYTINGVPFASTEIIHFRGMSLDGFVGLSPIAYAARMLTNAVDAEKYQSKVYETGIFTTGFFTTAERLIDKTYERLKKDIKAKSGIERAGEAQILEQGLRFERNTLSAQDSQIIEQMQFSVEEVARIYRIPKHLLYIDAKGGSTRSFATQAREFLTYSLSPILNNIEEELSLKLMNTADYNSGNYKIRFDTKALLRVDPAERGAYYKSLFNIGSMTPNEIRAEEGYAPIDGGDTTFVALNLAPIDQIEEIIQDKINQQINSTNG